MKTYLPPMVMAAVLAWSPATAQSIPDEVCVRGERPAAVDTITGRAEVRALPSCAARAGRMAAPRQPVIVRINKIRGRNLIRAIQKQKPGRMLNLKERSGPACGVPGVLACYWVLWQEQGRDGKLGPVSELIVDPRTGKILKETKSRRGTI